MGRAGPLRDRLRLTSGRILSGSWSRLGVPCTTRYSSAAVSPLPNGPSPRAAKTSTPARLKMSLNGPTGIPSACSGDMNPGEPIMSPVPVSEVASAAEEMPKSMIRGPSGASSTLDGFRSRWITPAVWMALSPSASPAASASSVAVGSGPCCSTASASDMPGT